MSRGDRRSALLAFALPLFTRLDRSGLLGHVVRRGILDALRAAPGASVAMLAERFAIDYKTALYHVRMLERNGCIHVVRTARATACYLAPRALGPPPERAILALAAIRGGAGTLAALARALDVPRANAGALLEALEERGLVHRDGARFVPSEAGEGFS